MGLHGRMTSVMSVRLIEAVRASQCAERRLRHLAILLTGARSYSDAADDMAVDDDREPARQVDAFAPRGDRQLEIDPCSDFSGRLAIGCGGLRLHQRNND